jgi:Fe2+ transport system protein FeoA
MSGLIPLSQLSLHQKGILEHLCNDCPALMKKKLLSLGFVKGTNIQVVRKTPLGCPIEIELAGLRFCLRKTEAQCIFITPSPLST